MDPRPRSLLLLPLSLLLLYTAPSARGQQSYTIDDVGLKILPSNTVQSGTTVTLICHVRVSHDNFPNLTHTFQLTQDSRSIFTSTTTEDTVMYVLDPARAADSGSYECEVTVKDKKRSTYSQTLTVTGLQTPILQLSTTRPYQNDELTATCSAPEEKGSLVFRFFQRFPNGDPLMIKQLRSTGNSSRTTLVLRQVGDSFLYCEYDISLDSLPSRHSNHSKEIQVMVKVIYIKPTMNVLPSTEVFEGDLVEVSCRVVSPIPGMTVFLTKDRRILKEANSTIIYQFKAQDHDAGEYVCKAERGSVQKENYKSINVKELFSKPHLTVDPWDPYEGDDFTLNCSVSYVNEMVDREKMRFVIYKDNVSVSESQTYRAKAEPSNNGNYSCRVSYKPQSIEKGSANVGIRAKVPVSKPSLSVVGGVLVLGKPFQLVCRSDSGTLPISYVLYGPGVEHQRKTVTKPRERAVFNSTGVSKVSDLDNFLCHATNRNGQPPMQVFGQQLHRSLRIIEPVSKPMVQPSSWSVPEGKTLTLVCSVKQGTLPIRFSWYHGKEATPFHFKESMKLEESHTITDVKRENEGKYYCVFSNPANETRYSERISIKVTLATWKKGLIAVFCILLLLALTVGCILKKHLRNCKRRRLGELSVKPAGTKAERLSLTLAEFDPAANVTPGMIGKSIWKDHGSISESDDQNSVDAAEPRYTEVQIRQDDANRAPVPMGSDAASSEARNSKQGVPEPADVQGSVEYAQLNHDTAHQGDDSHHGNPSVQDDHRVDIDNSDDTNAAACEN